MLVNSGHSTTTQTPCLVSTLESLVMRDYQVSDADKRLV